MIREITEAEFIKHFANLIDRFDASIASDARPDFAGEEVGDPDEHTTRVLAPVKLSAQLLPEGEVEPAVFVPLKSERRSSIVDGFFAHVLAGIVVDLGEGPVH